MPWLTKILFSVVCAALTFVCAVVFADLAFGVADRAVLVAINPFILVGLVEYASHALWFVCLLLGVWAIFLPPRRWWAHFIFYLAAVGAGVWASYSYQVYEWPEYPFEAGMEHVDPIFRLASVITFVSCAIVLASASVCAFAGRRLLRSKQPSHALQRTTSGCYAPGGSR